ILLVSAGWFFPDVLDFEAAVSASYMLLLRLVVAMLMRRWASDDVVRHDVQYCCVFCTVVLYMVGLSSLLRFSSWVPWCWGRILLVSAGWFFPDVLDFEAAVSASYMLLLRLVVAMLMRRWASDDVVRHDVQYCCVFCTVVLYMVCRSRSLGIEL
ncbi:unnamed protein product, partial [Ilex paraguariensis]